MTAADAILAASDGGVATITLNVPERRNAISYPMRTRLAELLGSFDENPAVRVVVLTGNGPAFCAGVDLGDATAPPAAALDSTQPLTFPLQQLSKPLLAAVNGPAVGGGFELVLASDLRIASTAAWFGLPEVTIGSLPGSGGTQRLPRAIPPAVAAEMVYGGNRLSAADALRYGLVSRLVEPDQLQATARELADRIAANAPLSIRAAKVALRAALEQPLSDGLTLERTLWTMLAGTHDREEGRAAFRERRTPDFRGE